LTGWGRAPATEKRERKRRMTGGCTEEKRDSSHKKRAMENRTSLRRLRSEERILRRDQEDGLVRKIKVLLEVRASGFVAVFV
jgi:hypothetical protein